MMGSNRGQRCIVKSKIGLEEDDSRQLKDWGGGGRRGKGHKTKKGGG